METDDRQLLDSWRANWSDLMDFEVFRVMTSQEAVEAAAKMPQQIRAVPYV